MQNFIRPKEFFRLFFIFIFANLQLFADDLQMTDLQSDRARFEADEFILEGSVYLENDWLSAQAQEARLGRVSNSERYDHLQLQEQVFFSFNQNEKIICKKALFDAKQGKMSFFANPVAYFSQKHKLKVEGNELELFFEKETREIKELLAKDAVKIEYGPFLTAQASDLRYLKDLQGISLELFSKEQTAKLFDTRGLSLDAHSFSLKGQKHSEIEQIIAFDGRGSILGQLLAKKAKDPMQFSAQEILWRDGRDVLELKKNVFLEQKNFIRIVASELLNLGFEKTATAYSLQFLQSFGDTDYFYLPLDHAMHIFCSGKAMLEKNYASFEREKNRQIFFEDEYCKIWSDRANLEFLEDDETRVCMKGEVKIASKGSQKELYALADRLDFFLKDQHLVLRAEDDRKVLFFDKSKNMQLSAEEISIRWNAQNPFENVEANGKVRCFFQAQELEEMRKIFSS